MVGELKNGDDISQWSETSGRISEIDNGVFLLSEPLMFTERVEASQPQPSAAAPNGKVGFPETVLAAAGSAFLSAILVNPLDVVKTRLQAQAAGAAYSHPLSDLTSRMAVFGPNMMFADLRCSPTCSRAGVHGTVSLCPPDCFQYKGTWDVFYKIVRQEGIARLWRGTNAGLALALPTVGIYLPLYDVFLKRFEEFASQNCTSLAPYAPLVAGGLARSLACTSCYPIELARTRMQAYKAVGKKSPGVFRTLIEVVSSGKTMPPNQSEVASSVKTTTLNQSLRNSRILFTGLGAQLARDVPYSAICWATLEPVRRKLLGLIGERENVASVLAANFSAGFVAGSFAAAATCPFDVAKTRRQIEKDPLRALSMTTRQTLLEIWRGGGMKGLFTGVGPRVGRAGPSVGIVVSFYEVVKYALHQHYNTT